MSNVDVFEILVAAVCSANLAVYAITRVHELREFIKKKRRERAEAQEMIAMLKAKNHECSVEIDAPNARIGELTEKLLKEKLLKGGNNDYDI